MQIVDALEDPRTITAIEMRGTVEHDGDYYAAKNGITIQCYGENGLYCHLPWFAIIEDGEVIHRLNGIEVACVTYEKIDAHKDKVREDTGESLLKQYGADYY